MRAGRTRPWWRLPLVFAVALSTALPLPLATDLVPGGELLVSGTSPAGVPADRPLSQAALDTALAQAEREWMAARPGVDLSGVSATVSDLADAELGRSNGASVTIDGLAAGHGWTVMYPDDTTPRMDLLTVVRHELGHVLGLGHGEGLMDPSLEVGEAATVPAAPAQTAAPSTETTTTTSAPASSSDPASTSATKTTSTTSGSAATGTGSSSSSSTTSTTTTTTDSPASTTSTSTTTSSTETSDAPSEDAAATTAASTSEGSEPLPTAEEWAVSLGGGQHQVSVSVDGADLVVTVDGATTRRPLSSVSRLAVLGGPGDDALLLDSTGAAIPVPVSFDGRGGSNGLATSGPGSAYRYDGTTGSVAGGGLASVTF
ncbi:MAG: hypothetical protein ACRD0S_02875, partial [Acidimicrobiales bacterium]